MVVAFVMLHITGAAGDVEDDSDILPNCIKLVERPTQIEVLEIASNQFNRVGIEKRKTMLTSRMMNPIHRGLPVSAARYHRNVPVGVIIQQELENLD